MRFTLAHRFVGLALATCMVASPLAIAATTDPFNSGIPKRDYAPAEGERYASGEVSEQTGAATYAIPIEVPPGRLGMQPSLGLSYSSAGALRGGLAVGWSFGVPFIERDPDFPYGSPHYRVDGQRLVRDTTDPMGGAVYRTEVDGSFTRYQFDPVGGWTVLSADGHTASYRVQGANRLYITEERDALGNAVRYFYTTVTVGGAVEIVPTSIEYTANDAAGLLAHAKVELLYAPLETCGGAPVGSSVDYHFGQPRLSGARRLTEVRASVRDSGAGAWRLARKVTLGYDATELTCAGSAMRYLTTVDVSAFSATSVESRQPTARFTYGAANRALGRTITASQVPREGGNRRGPTRGFYDLDGDGRVDHVEVVTDASCHLRVRRGLADGAFATVPYTIDLPSAAWQTPGIPHGLDLCTLGGQFAERPDLSTIKFCKVRSVRVNYQFVDYDGDGLVDLVTGLSGLSAAAGGDFPGNPLAHENNTGSSENQCPSGTIESGGGCSCPNASQVYDPSRGECGSPAPTCPEGSHPDFLGGCWDGNGDPVPPGGGSDPDGGPTCQITPNYPEHVGDAYAWRIQRNIGGTFAPIGEASMVLAPKPLPETASMLESDQPARASLPALVDFDGDGRLDMVAMTTSPTGTPPIVGEAPVQVWRGLAGGGFEATPVRWAFNQAFTPAFNSLAMLTAEAVRPAVLESSRALALTDINGDGLPDIVFRAKLGGVYVAYNGAGASGPPGVAGTFSSPQPIATVVGTPLDSPVDRDRTELVHEYSDDMWLSGTRGSVRRLVDLDGDGLHELTVFTPTAAGITATSSLRQVFRLFGGGSKAELSVLDPAWEAVESLVTAEDGNWSRTTDFIDLTGDGLPDAVYFADDAAGTATIQSDVAPTTLRLLTSVDNGRGGVTRFDYGFTNDTTVVDLDGQALSPRRVVRSITVEPGAGQPAMTSTYVYRHPVSGRSSPTDPTSGSFLGFAEIDVYSSGQSGPSARLTVNTYDYAPIGNDWGGHLATRATFLASGTAWTPLEHDLYVPAANPMLGGLSTMTFTSQHEHRVCADGATAASCAAQYDPTITRQEWTPYPATGTTKLWLKSVERTVTPVDLERYTRTAYEVRYTATTTRLLPTSVDRGWWLDWGGILFLPVSRTDTVYNPSGLPAIVRGYQSATVSGATTFEYDNVGQVWRTIRPRQSAVGSLVGTTFTYDANRIYRATATDELARRVSTRFDTATGQLVEQVGPDRRPACSPPANPCNTFQFQTERWIRDGFGRELSHERSFDPPAGGVGFLQRIDRIAAYYDAEIPTRLATWTMRDPNAAGAAVWVVDQRRLDGAGRTIDTTAMRQTAGQPDAITVYRYDAGGGLAAVESPDPRSDDGWRVTTTFTRDGAGRVTRVVHPDGGTETVAYHGLDTEVAQVGLSQSTRTIERRTGLGEVYELRELDNPTPGQTAITRYSRDGVGRITSVIDADNDATQIAYDWADHRISLTHGSRTWTFGYDLDGNPTTVLEPRPTGASAALYTSTTDYDVVGRPMRAYPATHGMSAARLAELGIGNRTPTYRPLTDQVATMTLPFGTINYSYDADGNVTREVRALKAPTLAATITQSVDRTYDALGNLATVAWDDGTQYRYTTDARGAVATVAWRNPVTASFDTIASYTRAVAGQPRSRVGYSQRRDWQFDAVGRVTYDRVWRSGVGTTLAELNIGYDDFGNVAFQSGTAFNLVQDSTFTYDATRRLTRALGANGYDAAFTYSAAGNIRTAIVSGTSMDRAVTYSYGAVDSQAVDRLTNSKTGATVATFNYDVVGQLTHRVTPAGTTDMAWDADGILREVRGPTTFSRNLVGPGAERMIGIDATGVTFWFDDSEALYGTNGVLARRYHHIAAGEPIARVENGTTFELQYADALQNLRVAADRAGTVTAAFNYGAFGEILASYGAAGHKRQFNGKDAEPVAGLRNYGYRSYDPYTLRWVSPDPVATMVPDAVAPQLANRYSFSANNPVRYLDPDGLAPGDEEMAARVRAEVEKMAHLLKKESGFWSGLGKVVEGVISTPTSPWGLAIGFVSVPDDCGGCTREPEYPMFGGGDSGPDLPDRPFGLRSGQATSTTAEPPPPTLDPTGQPQLGPSRQVTTPDNLASPQRTQHIIEGDGTGGGHMAPGMPGKSVFPAGWSANKIMELVSDVATAPGGKWTRLTGPLGEWFTRRGDAARFLVEGTRDGINIHVIVEPWGEGIITAFPVP